MKTVNISRAASTMKLIVVLMLLTATTTWAQSTFSGGSGEQTDPYQISKVEDWDALANSVNDGTSTYSGVYFKLTKDIDDPVTTMVGNSEQHAFQGFFIGNGKKLNVNYVTEEQYTAPFRYIDGATITGLTAGAPAGVRAFNLNFGGESTGIVSMSTDSKDLKDSGAWYDMQGRKLNTKPAKSGLYIHRGNKVVVK